MAVPIWLGRYLDIRYCEGGRDRTGIDDWGIIRLVHAEQFGIALPSFQKDDPETILNYWNIDDRTWIIPRGQERLGDFSYEHGIKTFGLVVDKDVILTCLPRTGTFTTRFLDESLTLRYRPYDR